MVRMVATGKVCPPHPGSVGLNKKNKKTLFLVGKTEVPTHPPTHFLLKGCDIDQMNGMAHGRPYFDIRWFVAGEDIEVIIRQIFRLTLRHWSRFMRPLV